MQTLFEKLQTKWLHSYKVNRMGTALRRIVLPAREPRVIFIFGCQRSGTTLLRNFIGLDSRVLDVGEGDPPFFHQETGDRYLRLKEDTELAALVKQTRCPWVLLKPLHDTQRASHLLGAFPGSKGIAIFRHYRPVIDSHLRYYSHKPLEYLRPLLHLDTSSWMLDGMDSDTLEVLRELLPEAGGRPVDLYALFWWVRNQLLIQQAQGKCLFVSYESLVSQPDQVHRRLEHHLGWPLSRRSTGMPHKASLNHGTSISLNSSIQNACEEVLLRLRSIEDQFYLVPAS